MTTRYEFSLSCVTPLLMHADNVAASDALREWRTNPAHKSLSVAGDDRSPAWTWKAWLYSDGKHLVIPNDVLMAALRGAGASIKIEGARGKTFKSLSQTAITPEGEYLTLLVGGEQVRIEDINAIDGTFQEHCEAVKRLGFSLFLKRIPVGRGKHIRVRPRFDDWEVRGVIGVSDGAITGTIVSMLFSIAGRERGLLDWRPSSPTTPGIYGQFTARIKQLK
ncbi:MAG TPA: hypothetical protein VM389_13140 [Phycisphaerae bacterium]|nr:hypothetical protein [Phycisphaerae bacterium]